MRHLSRFITVPLVLAGTIAVSIPAANALLPTGLPVAGGLGELPDATGSGGLPLAGGPGGGPAGALPAGGLPLNGLPLNGLPGPAGLVPGAARTLGAVAASATRPLTDRLDTVRYWTPARMRAAKPAPSRRDASPDSGLGLLPGLLSPAAPAAPAAQAPAPAQPPGAQTPAAQAPAAQTPAAQTPAAQAPAAQAPAAQAPAIPQAAGSHRSVSSAQHWQNGGSVTRTTGKVFFTMDGGDYVCSASSVRSANKDTVVTAGHCVNSGPGEFASRWAFVPAYSDGDRPFGTWTARRLFAPTAWTEHGDIDYDTGFAVVDTSAGRHLSDAVGAQDIGFGASRGQYAYSFGYPATGPYDGNRLLYCQGTAANDRYGTADQGLTCDMTDGSSGGPWLSRFDPKSGRGTLTSVNSFGYDGVPNVMWGPYFGDEIHSVYTTAQHS